MRSLVQNSATLIALVGMSTAARGAAVSTDGSASAIAPAPAGSVSTPLADTAPSPTPAVKKASGAQARGDLRASPHKWTVDLGYEFHHMVRQGDLGGDDRNHNVSYLSATGGYRFDKLNRVFLSLGVLQRYIADSQETGVRSDDALVGYTRLFFWKDSPLQLRITPRVYLPLSFESQNANILALPALGVRGDYPYKSWNFALSANALVYMLTGLTGSGGAQNPSASTSLRAEVEYALPMWSPLSFGVALYGGTTWYRQASGNLNATGISSATGGVSNPAEADPTYASQPVLNRFGQEVYASYLLGQLSTNSTVDAVRWDAQLAYANGEPTLGYQSSLHDGVSHFNLFYRHTSQVYASLNARF